MALQGKDEPSQVERLGQVQQATGHLNWGPGLVGSPPCSDGSPLWQRPADELQGTCQFEDIGVIEPTTYEARPKESHFTAKGTAP